MKRPRLKAEGSKQMVGNVSTLNEPEMGEGPAVLASWPPKKASLIMGSYSFWSRFT